MAILPVWMELGSCSALIIGPTRNPSCTPQFLSFASGADVQPSLPFARRRAYSLSTRGIAYMYSLPNYLIRARAARFQGLDTAEWKKYPAIGTDFHHQLTDVPDLRGGLPMMYSLLEIVPTALVREDRADDILLESDRSWLLSVLANASLYRTPCMKNLLSRI